MNGNSIAGCVALVTGANRGIGRAITRALIERGARRVYAGARDTRQLDTLLNQLGGRVVPLRLDVTDPDQVTAAATGAPDVNLLFNNAGIVEYGRTWADPNLFEASKRETEVNVGGTVRMTQALAPTLARNGGGAVVNIISIAALANVPLFISYSLSKAALHSFTQSARMSLRAQGTAVIGVYPGPVDTDMTTGLPFDKTPPQDVARAILDGVEAGIEDVFPDPMSRAMGATFGTNPKELEREVAAMFAA